MELKQKFRVFGMPIIIFLVSMFFLVFAYVAVTFGPKLKRDESVVDDMSSSSRRAFPEWYDKPIENRDRYTQDSNSQSCSFLCYNRLREPFLESEEKFLIDAYYLFNFTNFQDFDVYIAKRGSLLFIYLCEGDPAVRCVLRKDCGLFSCEYKQMCELCTSCYIARACWFYCMEPENYESTLRLFENDHGKESWITNFFLASFRQRCWRMDHSIKKYCRKDKEYYDWMDPDEHVKEIGSRKFLQNENNDFDEKC